MACQCSIDTIDRECGANASGVKPVLAISCEDEVDSIAASVDHSVATINMRAAAVGPPAVTKGYFRLWYPSSRGGDFSATQDAESGTWKTECKFFIPKQTSAKAVVLNGLGEDNNICVVTDKNGKRRIVGELENPANVVTKEVVLPKNGYEVTITWESAHSPYFFTGTLDTSPT